MKEKQPGSLGDVSRWLAFQPFVEPGKKSIIQLSFGA